MSLRARVHMVWLAPCNNSDCYYSAALGIAYELGHQTLWHQPSTQGGVTHGHREKGVRLGAHFQDLSGSEDTQPQDANITIAPPASL